MEMRDQIQGWRTRFAPSPTGALHAGSVRTALFNWLAARATGGTFLLRVEDTDQGRYHPGSEMQILESLRWLGLEWDEGPEVGGPHDPYVQSLRTDLYRLEADRLVEAGAAYWCTCTPARLEQMRAGQRAAGRPTRYDRRCLGRQEEVAAEREAGVPAVLRQRIPSGRTGWDDLIRGPIAIDNAEIDDQVLLKGDGYPTYHLANVVDDHAMEVSHVIRAEEWIPSTPKHLCLYAELAERFSLDRVNPAPAVFDAKRLDALNGLHIRRLAPEALAAELEPWLPGATEAQRLALVPLLRERMSRLDEAPRLAGPLLDGAPWPEEIQFPPKKVDSETAGVLLDAAVAEVEGGGLEDILAMRGRLTALLEEQRGTKARDGFRVLYIAILGSPQGVPVFDAMRFIGPEAAAARLRAARERLDGRV